MDEPTTEEKAQLLEARLRDLRNRHYVLELDKIAAQATDAADTPSVIARIEELQLHTQRAYEALKNGNHTT